MNDTQLAKQFRDIINEQIDIYHHKKDIVPIDSIPDTPDIPIENKYKWLKLPDVVCVFVDMLNSTKLGASSHEESTASAYHLFTGTAIRLFASFEAPYIDVRGDGAFALFDANQAHRALAAAVTFKTFALDEFEPRVQFDTEIDIGCHIGIDQKTVLVRKLGFKRYRGRSDRQNEVWAGKPVNMASKLASLTLNGEILISKRYFDNLTDAHALLSCECTSGRRKSYGKGKMYLGKVYLILQQHTVYLKVSDGVAYTV